MAAPVCTIDATGLHVPAYADVLAYFQDAFRGIFGADVYLGNDSQDGQWLAILAAAHHDTNMATAAAYNARSPATAQGVGLSSVVKINGIARDIPTNSTVDLVVVGQAGTTILDGRASDGASQWALPASVVIPPGGSITVTASAVTEGAVAASAGTITTITTPTLGWQTVNNPAAAEPGAPVETDAALRVRQGQSVALPSRTVLEGISGAVVAVPGVARWRGYENDTASTDANGIPAHSIAYVVEAGDAQAIAEAISAKKTPGTGTYGTTTQSVVDVYGIPHAIKFSRPTDVPISMVITVEALAGYSSAVGVAIKAALAAYVNALGIGAAIYLTRLYVPANLTGADALTFEISALTIARDGGALAASNIMLDWDEAASCDVADIALTVT